MPERKQMIFTFDELVKFIKNMDDNTVITIASEHTTDKDGNIVDALGWWSIAKLNYANSNTLLINYYGGGYPYAYPIDEEDDTENIEYALRKFVTTNPSFAGKNSYLIDTDYTDITEIAGINTPKLKIEIPLENCTDSMTMDSGTVIATYGTKNDYVKIDVCGDIDVTDENTGINYRWPSRMPPEILEQFENGTAYENEKLRIDSNNWFAYVHVKDGITDDNDFVCEDEISTWTPGMLRTKMEELAEYYKNN